MYDPKVKGRKLVKASLDAELMMNCEASRILISSYLDGELSDQEVELFKAHLQVCEDCVRYLQQQEILKNALKHYSLFQNLWKRLQILRKRLL